MKTMTGRLLLVTLRFPRNPSHNPHGKQAGPCPANGMPCTDMTGEHHTIAVWCPNEMTAEEMHVSIPLDQFPPGTRVTRVESIKPGSLSRR